MILHKKKGLFLMNHEFNVPMSEWEKGVRGDNLLTIDKRGGGERGGCLF